MPETQKKENKVTFLEGLGVGALLLFFAGIFFYLSGSYYYKDVSGYEPWLLIVIGFPFIIQVPVFFRFFIIYKKDKTLETFFIFYSIFMCVGLSSYSLFWWIYNSFHIENWRSSWLATFSILSLLLILFLIWSIINCTRVITRGSFEISDGLLDSSDISHEQYEELCNKLDTILKNGDILDYDFNELKEIIEADSSTETGKKDYQNKIKIITDVFSDLEKIKFSISNDSQTEKVISVITDTNQPAQIKPLKRILLFLRENNNHWIHRAITTKNFQIVTKHLLIKSLNKILKNAEFFDEKEFSAGDWKTPAEPASEYFKKNKNRYFPKKVQIENRNLLNEHVLKLLKSPNPNNEQKPEENYDSELPKPKNKYIEWCGNIIKLGLTDDKGLKIKEGIARFPFETMSFFFTIFLCITYLFSFSFAFHDKSELSNSYDNSEQSNTKSKMPALFMINDFSSSDINNNTNTNSNTNNNTNTNFISNTNSNANVTSNANTVLNSTTENEIYKHPTFFVFYAPSGSGIETEDINEDIDNVNQNTNTKQKVSNSRITEENQKLKTYRYEKNKQNFNDLLEIIKKRSPNAKTIYIEIVGRADDSPQGNAKQTYSSNYELSMARAQNLKFELIRKLEDTPDILEKIEWICLPVSNDQSLGGDHPLNDSNNRPSIVMNSSSILDIKDMIIRINERFKEIPEPDGDKNPAEMKIVMEKKKILLTHIEETKKLFKEGKITNKNAGEELFSKLRKEFESYEAIAVEKIKNLKPGTPNYDIKLNEFVELQKKVDEALNFFKSGADNANKRVTEIYVTSIPKDDYVVPRIDLNLMDYILYTIKTGEYGGIKPITMYSKFLSLLVNIVYVFFLVVFFNALLSVKRVNEEDEAFNSA